MIPEGPFKVTCGDGVQRTFHRSGVYSERGFVYVNHRRVYGRVLETYEVGEGFVFKFGTDQTGANAHLIRVPEAAAV